MFCLMNNDCLFCGLTNYRQMIVHDDKGNPSGFFYEIDGVRLGEMVYHMKDPGTMVIEHTEVDDSLQGQGIGKKLLAQLVDFAREKDIKVISACTYANATFQRMKEWQDVLA